MSVFLFAINNHIVDSDNLHISDPLGVNNAGYSKIDSANLSTRRPEGRKDYQFIFIKSGICYMMNENGEETPIQKNTVILYRPGEYQHYKFYMQDRTEIFWIHFGGTWVEKILEDIGISKLCTFHFEHADSFINTVNFIINTTRKKENLGKLSCASKLMELFSVIGRRDEAIISPANTPLMDKICLDIANNYFLETTNEEYAFKYNMSVSYFIKSFKATTGTTPQQYKAMQRLTNAESLLIDTNLKINEISNILGFSDSLYFSKFFNKQKGLSPSEFRNKYKNPKKND